MAERYNDYYRLTWNASGVYSPVITKRQLIAQLESALLELNEKNELSVNIIQYKMTESQFKNRPINMKNYGIEAIEN